MRTITLLVAGAVLIYALSNQAASGQAPASSPPLFQAGQQYIVTWDCSVVVSPQGQVGKACYSEVVTVQAIRSDGWVLVTDADGIGWSINPARLIGFTLAERGQRASR